MAFGGRMKGPVALAMAFGLFCGQAGALSLDYCSPQNLGVGAGAWHKYQSNGWCQTHCGDTYAVAIVQNFYCWCSNDLPADTVPLSDCDKTCPGYGTEYCGSQDGTLYGYRVLFSDPSSTVAPNTPKTSSTSSSSSHSTPPVQHTSSKPTSSSSSSSLESSKTTKMTATSLETVSGTVVTHTVVQTSVVAAPPAQSTETPVSSSGPSGGTIAGAVIGGLAGFAAIIGIAVFVLLRFRRRRDDDAENSGSGVARNTSVLSKSGLLGSAPEKAHLPPIHTGGRRSNNAFDVESSSPGSDRRHSRPIFYDQRLNPSALMDNDSSSRASIGTIQDARDYTRTLNIRNPDPADDSDNEPDHEHQVQAR